MTHSGGIVPFRGRGATCIAAPTIPTSILKEQRVCSVCPPVDVAGIQAGPLLFEEEFEEVIMIEVVTEEMRASD
jgi:hypothetical protein